MRNLLLLLFLVTSVSSLAQERFTVYFDFDRYDLAREEKQRLDEYFDSDKLRGLQLSMFGHCDAKGSNAYNEALSAKRVATIRTYFLNRGLEDSGIVEARGFGETQPLNENRTEEERRVNRRVEILFTIGQPPAQEPIQTPEPVDTLKEGETPVTLQQQIADTLVKEGSQLVLKNMHFIGGTAIMVKESLPTLEELLAVMKANPQLEIEVQGHICCQEGPGDGIDMETGKRNLSVARARAIYNYLLDHGIEKKRLDFRGFGHSKPLFPFPEQSPGEAAANRRVEIRIVKK